MEGDAVEVARVVARFELGLGHGRLEGHVPQTGGLSLVGLTAIEIAKEPLLGSGPRTLVDGAVVDVPVNREAEPAEYLLERLLVLDGKDVACLLYTSPSPRDR